MSSDASVRCPMPMLMGQSGVSLALRNLRLMLIKFTTYVKWIHLSPFSTRRRGGDSGMHNAWKCLFIVRISHSSLVTELGFQILLAFYCSNCISLSLFASLSVYLCWNLALFIFSLLCPARRGGN